MNLLNINLHYLNKMQAAIKIRTKLVLPWNLGFSIINDLMTLIKGQRSIFVVAMDSSHTCSYNSLIYYWCLKAILSKILGIFYIWPWMTFKGSLRGSTGVARVAPKIFMIRDLYWTALYRPLALIPKVPRNYNCHQTIKSTGKNNVWYEI